MQSPFLHLDHEYQKIVKEIKIRIFKNTKANCKTKAMYVKFVAM